MRLSALVGIRADEGQRVARGRWGEEADAPGGVPDALAKLTGQEEQIRHRLVTHWRNLYRSAICSFLPATRSCCHLDLHQGCTEELSPSGSTPFRSQRNLTRMCLLGFPSDFQHFNNREVTVLEQELNEDFTEEQGARAGVERSGGRSRGESIHYSRRWDVSTKRLCLRQKPVISAARPRLPTRLARTRFKPSPMIRFPRFDHPKTPIFDPLSTPPIIDDTPEQLRGKNRLKTRAV